LAGKNRLSIFLNFIFFSGFLYYKLLSHWSCSRINVRYYKTYMPFLIFLLIHCVHYGPFFSKFWSNLNFHFGILIIINVCRENSDFALVCRGSKSLENTELEQE
jgi:fucose 4-O-acetylase-like acetyltransferase